VSILVAGIVYAGLNIYLEVRDAGVITESWLPFILLGIALLIALGFEFVNGFHDTANAVATVIYTHSLVPNVAVLWSGLWNFIGVMVSSGARRLRDHLAVACGTDPSGPIAQVLPWYLPCCLPPSSGI
jgi:PiT family inorganic phosphate transporter